ncbi:MAG: hypothetical protein JWQ98_2525 [Chlorobi bacterium]|nr:hypothetical protein [Chlorobiota bacterium]
MRHRTRCLCLLLVIAAVGSAHGQRRSDSLPEPRATALNFTENRGQIVDSRGALRPDLLYTAALGNVRLYFRRDGLSYVFNLHHNDSARAHRPLSSSERAATIPDTVERYRMDMTLVGANPVARIESGEPSELTNNYYLSHCPGGITGVRNFHRLTYHDIYPNIDLAFYTRDGALKYDFIVRPGGDPAMIHLRYDGAEGMKKAGERIVVSTPLGAVEEGAPLAYQSNGKDMPMSDGTASGNVGCRMLLDRSDIRFAVDRYDGARTLVIDPRLLWATYVGGNGEDIVSSYLNGRLAVDGQKNIYMNGTTSSTDFPVVSGVQSTLNGQSDEFVIKFSPGGTEIWGTYLGGSLNEEHGAISVDLNGNVAVTGATFSSDFPLAGPTFQSRLVGPSDIFIATFTPGGLLKWSTYYGGSDYDYGIGVRIDPTGNVIVAGAAESSDFPLTRPGPGGVAVIKFNAGGSRLWAYGYEAETVFAVATDAVGNIVLTGTINTAGTSIVTAGAQQPTYAGNGDAYVLKLDPLGTPIWGTYFGGAQNEVGGDIAVDQSNGGIVFTGYTSSPDFPVTPGAVQSRLHGIADAFVVRLSSAGLLVWSTYLGGATPVSLGAINSGEAVCLSPCGDVFLTGYTACSDFPVTTDATQPRNGGGDDGFLVKFDPRGRLVWATYCGGEGAERPRGIAVDSLEGTSIAGGTFSRRFPTTPGSFRPNYNGGTDDAFLAKFFLEFEVRIAADGPLTICEGKSVTLSAPAGYLRYNWSTNEHTQSIRAKAAGTYWFNALDQDGCPGLSDTVTVKINKRPALTIKSSGPLAFCAGDSVLLSIAAAGIVSYRWLPPAVSTSARVWVGSTGDYSVQVVDANGCTWDVGPVHVQVNPVPPVPVFSFGDTLRVCADSSAVLDVGTGNGYRKYRWFDGGGRLIDSARMIRVTQGGNYSVIVYDALGCFVGRAVTVAYYPPVKPVLQVHGPLSFCEGDSVLLNVGGGTFVDYRWPGARVTAGITVRASGRYFARVIDANGCPGVTDTVAVTVHPVPVATIGGALFVCTDAVAHYSVPHRDSARYHWTCAGNGAIVGVEDSSGVTVHWGGAGQGMLTVSVIDTLSGCSATSSASISIGTTLKPDITGPRSFCAGDTIELDAGSGYERYQWIGGEQTQKIRVHSAGRYGVIVRDIGGCTGASDTITIIATAPRAPLVSGPAKVCINSTATYAVAEITGDRYEWSVSGGAIVNGAGSHQIDVQWGGGPAGLVNLTERSGEGSCAGIAPALPVAIGTALEPVITASGPLALCPGDSVDLDAGAGYASYGWSSGELSRVIRVGDSGTYHVTVSDAGGCSGSSVDLRVDHHRAPIVSIMPAGPVELIEGDSVDLDAGAGHALYNWGGGRTARHLIVKNGGTYAVAVIDSGGCRGGDSVRVVLVPRGGYQGHALVELGSATAAPGERVLLPIILDSSDHLPVSAAMRAYQARLRFNGRLLLPAGATPIGVMDGADRVLTVDGTIPAGFSGGRLRDLEFIAALGDTLVTPLRLERFTIGRGDSLVVARTVDGVFTLRGVCMSGGNRLVVSDGALVLKPVRPNPVSDIGELQYEVVEDGRTRLSVSDALGRQVLTLVDGDVAAGAYSVTFGTAGLSSGIYFATLGTRTARLCVAFQITH